PPPATASPTPSATPSVSPTPSATASPTQAASGPCDIQPSAVESLTVSPESGSGGSTATVEVDWSPDAGEGCPNPEAQLRVNGEETGSPIPVGGDPAEIEIEIPEDVTGDIPVSLVAADGDANVLASTQFGVDEDGGGADVSSWLLVAALVVATLVGIAVQRLSSRRKAMYGRR
ncbi:MAG TPA: hypothetical protein VHL54_10830, partial [Actinomycetota bacterium]|nr:hypothetical protein [Actinomycetota bacterium]